MADYANDSILTPDDVAQWLGVPREAVLASHAPRFTAGRRAVRFRAEDALRFHAEMQRLAATPPATLASRIAPERGRAPESLRGRPWEAFVYAFYNPHTRLTKIGIARRVDARQRALECACGVHVQFLHAARGHKDVMQRREFALHAQFAEYRALGEWFALPKALRATLYEAMDHG